jgi:peptidoglycan/LPS O-acetylase OafA/YrhL
MVLDFHFQTTSIFFWPLARLGFPHFGWAGVDLFFILSGFLVGGLVLNEWKQTGSFDARRFFKRRALKIWPAFYFFLAVEVAVRVHPINTFLIGNLLSIQNYTVNSIPHTWSLAVEEQFYGFLILMMVVLSKNRRAHQWILGISIALAVTIVLLRTVLNFYGFYTWEYTHTRADGLFWGLIVAVMYHFYPRRLRVIQNQRTILFMIVCAALGGLYFADLKWVSHFRVTIADIGLLAFFLLLLQNRNDHSFAYKAVAKCGMFSYGIYLWHLSVRIPIAALARHIPLRMSWPITHVLPYLAAITLGVLSTKIIEVPFLKLRERLTPASAPAVSQARSLADPAIARDHATKEAIA